MTFTFLMLIFSVLFLALGLNKVNKRVDTLGEALGLEERPINGGKK